MSSSSIGYKVIYCLRVKSLTRHSTCELSCHIFVYWTPVTRRISYTWRNYNIECSTSGYMPCAYLQSIGFKSWSIRFQLLPLILAGLSKTNRMIFMLFFILTLQWEFARWLAVLESRTQPFIPVSMAQLSLFLQYLSCAAILWAAINQRCRAIIAHELLAWRQAEYDG